MTTEDIISEFIIRGRLKLGDLAVDIDNITTFGGEYYPIVKKATTLRVFLNALNSDFLIWTEREIIKRIEYYTLIFDLNSNPIYQKDWLKKFQPVSQIVIKSPVYIQLPEGEGYVY